MGEPLGTRDLADGTLGRSVVFVQDRTHEGDSLAFDPRCAWRTAVEHGGHAMSGPPPCRDDVGDVLDGEEHRGGSVAIDKLDEQMR